MREVRGIVLFDEQPSVLRCSGDEDRATQALRRRALSRALCAERDVEVDLSGLLFADASFMVDLAMVARRVRKSGQAMWIHGAAPHIHRLIELVGLHRLPGVHVAPAAA